jgi:hypothetical protein
MEENPLDKYSTSRIMRRCGQLGIPFDEVIKCSYFINSKRHPKSKVQYRDGVAGAIGWGSGTRKLEDEDIIPFDKKELLPLLGLGRITLAAPAQRQSPASVTTTKHKIRELNSQQFGSFGEYIFAHYVVNVLKRDLVKLHRDNADFIFQGKKIDVGSRRQLDKYFRYQTIRNKDVSVYCYDNCCFINYPQVIEATLTWSEMTRLFEDWREKHELVPTHSGTSFKKEYDDIKKSISHFFSVNGYKAKIIYRTNTDRFGLGESPGNLLPNTIDENSVRVYVDFNSYKRTVDNVRFIIAFPESAERDIPRLQAVRLRSGTSHEKIDLIAVRQTKHRCCFESIEELKQRFFKRYPLPSMSVPRLRLTKES